MVGLTITLAGEVVRHGITVNCVSPGGIETEADGAHNPTPPGFREPGWTDPVLRGDVTDGGRAGRPYGPARAPDRGRLFRFARGLVCHRPASRRQRRRGDVVTGPHRSIRRRKSSRVLAWQGNLRADRREETMMPPETRYAKSGERRIAYQVVGTGPFDLVFVPASCPTSTCVGRCRSGHISSVVSRRFHG